MDGDGWTVNSEQWAVIGMLRRTAVRLSSNRWWLIGDSENAW